MLLQFRGLSQPTVPGEFPHMTLEAAIDSYEPVLLKMPQALLMNRSSVRCHLVWKRMLGGLADGQIKFNTMTRSDVRAMCCDGAVARELLNVPSWLPLYKLAAQMRCPAELLCMWVSLWSSALKLDGAASAIFENAAGISCVLHEYLSIHVHPPSPRSLMLLHLQIAEGSDAPGNFADAGGAPAKRRCQPRVGAEAPTQATAGAPAKALP